MKSYWYRSSHNNLQTKEQPTFFGKEKDQSFFNQQQTSPNQSFFNNHNVQPKLTVGQPNDKYEQEADQVAEQVVQGFYENQESIPSPKPSGISSLQRKPIFESEQESAGDETLQTKSDSTSPTVSPSVQNNLDSSKGRGKKLSPKSKTHMEQAFGQDFSGVNIHTDQSAANMNQQLGAKAFTHGQDIYFNEGQFDEDSREGKRLLAHELTHTIQQRSSTNILQRQSNQGPVNRMQKRLKSWKKQLPKVLKSLKTQAQSASTSQERELAAIQISLLEAARKFGQIHGSALVFRRPNYRVAAGTITSRTKWVMVLRNLNAGGLVEPECIDILTLRPLPKIKMPCPRHWEKPYMLNGKLVVALEVYRSTVLNNPEIQQLTHNQNYAPAFYVGQSEGLREMTKWGFWDYIDVLTPIFSSLGAAINSGKALKALGMAGRTLKGFWKGIKNSKIITKALVRIRKLRGTIANMVRPASQAVLSSLKSAQGWAARNLRLSADVVANLSTGAIRKLNTLGVKALERIRLLSDAAKRVLLGCASPCKVSIQEINKWLATTPKAGGNTLVTTVKELMQALPKGINKTAIKNKLKRHPALMTFIKEAKLTKHDFEVLSKFLTAADKLNKKTAGKTFTRFLNSMIPAKTGNNIALLNQIAQEATKKGGRIVNTMKGAMFENWVKLFISRFQLKSFSRLTFKKRAGLSLSKKRTFDGFLPTRELVYEFKHTFSKVPADQVRDYLKILKYEAANSKRFNQIVYVFPSKEAAKINKHLLQHTGFKVKYVSPAGKLLDFT